MAAMRPPIARPSALCLVLVCVWLIGTGAVPARAEIAGKADAVAGDRLDIGGITAQLFGVDAPERGQACLRDGKRWDCGFAATAALAFRTAGQWVVCAERGIAADGTPLALCWLGGRGGPEVNGWMVAAGWGLADQPPLFADAEAAARTAGRGIWGSGFVSPAEWRQGARLPIETIPAEPAGLCTVKGSITAEGERIYHLPGGAFYPNATIDPARGERWFCSEADAEAAGWRRSPR